MILTVYPREKIYWKDSSSGATFIFVLKYSTMDEKNIILSMEEDLKSKILDDKKFKATILKHFVQHRSNNDNQAKIKIKSEIISSELKVELVKSVNHIKNKSE